MSAEPLGVASVCARVKRKNEGVFSPLARVSSHRFHRRASRLVPRESRFREKDTPRRFFHAVDRARSKFCGLSILSDKSATSNKYNRTKLIEIIIAKDANEIFNVCLYEEVFISK